MVSDPRLIVALDFDSPKTANNLVDELGDQIEFYKIGLGMIASGGFDFAARLKSKMGKKVFLDLKLFDIGVTVEKAVRSMTSIGPDLLTVHGDPFVVQAAVKANLNKNTKILAVTVLTSLDRRDLDDAMIVPGDVERIVGKRAARSFAAGADGVICSPREIRSVRALPGASNKLIVTPGIRLPLRGVHDQKRVTSPGEAIEAGADHIVVGRPISRSSNPSAAVGEILREMRHILDID